MSAEWLAVFDVSRVFHREDISEGDRLVLIASRLRVLATQRSDEELAEIAEELTDAATDGNVAWFDAVWNAFYDWADYNRVWVKTID